MIAAIVLAAGYSSRMGRFKPLLPIGGVIALERVLDLFIAAGIGEITVVTGYRADALEPVLARKGVRIVHNPDYDAGMYSSVAAGARSLAEEVEACFMLPADMPLVRPRTIQRLAETHRSHPKAVLYPVFQGRRGHPPLISRNVLAETLHGNEPGGLRTLLARYEQRAGEVAVIDEGIHLDLDTPADLVRAQALADCHDAPSPAECEAIFANPSKEVAEVARKLAVRLTGCGVPLDLAVVRASSLLYKVGTQLAQQIEFPKVAHILAHRESYNYSAGFLNEASIVYLAASLVAGDTLVAIQHDMEARTGMRLEEILADTK